MPESPVPPSHYLLEGGLSGSRQFPLSSRGPPDHRPSLDPPARPFAQALLAAWQDRADRLLDELTDLANLAINTFRQLLSDQNTSPATRLKAAKEIVKLVEAQRPRNAPCPCGSKLKFKRYCANPLNQARAA